MRPRPKGPGAKAEAKARGYEAEAKILASGQFGLEVLTSLKLIVSETRQSISTFVTFD